MALHRLILAAVAAAGLVSTGGMIQSAGAQTYNLRYSDIGPPRGPRADATKWWAEELEKRSDGRIKVEFFWSQALVKGKDNLKATGAGLTETGLIIGIYTPADLPVWNVANTPFMFADSWVGMRAMWEARAQLPELVKETSDKGVKILLNNTTGPVQILSAKKPIRTRADLQGMKVRSAGGWTELLNNLGASTLDIKFGELYAALDRGTIDATINYTPFVKSYKHYEVSKYVTVADMGMVLGYGIGINEKLWKSMPKDIQDIIATVSDEYHDVYGKLTIEDTVESRKDLEAGIDGHKIEFIDLPESERAEWKKLAEPFIVEWKEDMKKRGHDGDKILSTILNLQAKYQKIVAEQGYPWTR